jgi:hypothetical protein
VAGWRDADTDQRDSHGDGEATMTAADSAHGGVRARARAPYNPFARTLASKEAALAEASQQHVEASPKGHEQGARPALDVDAFKNILMTGAPVPAGLSTGSPRPYHPSITATPAAADPAYGASPTSSSSTAYTMAMRMVALLR